MKPAHIIDTSPLILSPFEAERKPAILPGSPGFDAAGDRAFAGKLVPPACRLPAGQAGQAGKTPDTLPSARPGVWFVYVIECEDGSFYKGFTEDLPRRWKQHLAGTAAEWTKRRRPKQVFYWEACYSEAGAIAREEYLKSGIGREWFKREVVDQPEAWEPASVLLERIKMQRNKTHESRP